MSNLSKLLSRSGTLAQQGDLAGARAELEKAVRDHGRRSEPWISLAAIHGMSGNFSEALRCARKAVELAPNSLQAYINLAGAAQAVGDLPLAAEALQRIHGFPGCPPHTGWELGRILFTLGRWAEAEAPLSEYLDRNPGDGNAAITYAKTLAKNGKIDAAVAVIENRRRHQLHDINAVVQIARIYLEAGQSQNAWQSCNLALSEQPNEPEALFLKANLLEFEGRLGEAIDILEQLARILPENPRILSNLSSLYWGSDKPEAAIGYARASLRLNPHHIPALLQLSAQLMTRDPAEARRLQEQAETLAPHDLSVRVNKGRLLEFEGDKLGAWACLKEAIQCANPDVTAATIVAGIAPSIGKADEAIAMLEGLVNHPGIANDALRSLRFALAKLCDKAKQYDRAFEHAIIANRLKNIWFDRSAKQVLIERLKTVYSDASIASLPRSHIHSDLPIFIVGMPRSGTSLLEQILSCHSKVHARGETTDIIELSESIPYYPDGVRNLTQEKCDSLADTHLQRLRAIAPHASRFTDKLPGNYMTLGLISQIFPGARIINCRRDPRDVCLSNYMIEFISGHPYAYDLEALAVACQDYQDLMRHWKRVLPIPILDIRYEDLIDDPRTWVAKVLDFCGLEWEDACMNFHKASRQVVTASYDQVRKPLYNTSVARWKNYEHHLAPVSRILGLHDDNYPD